jgi:hypothetical protein
MKNIINVDDLNIIASLLRYTQLTTAKGYNDTAELCTMKAETTMTCECVSFISLHDK